MRELTEIKHVEKEDKMISEGTEDGTSMCTIAMYTLANLLVQH